MGAGKIEEGCIAMTIPDLSLPMDVLVNSGKIVKVGRLLRKCSIDGNIWELDILTINFDGSSDYAFPEHRLQRIDDHPEEIETKEREKTRGVT